ncbi:MAG TPA: hypothetical protein VLG38_05565 [Gammaproteobacteria bacterium]|nr:hypothetical protein [Gammaproteobacteria bacterium]
MQKIIKMVVVLLITSTCWAQSDQLLVDQYFSPYTGAALNLSAFHAYIYVDDTWFPSSENEETVPWFVARTLKLGAEELLSELLMVVQHEIFGHGYRLREYHFSDVGYRIGIGYGSTGFLDSEFNTLPYPKRAAVAAAGMEANAIFSQQIRQKWITSDQVDRREATLYLITTLDQSEYILGVEDDLMYMGNDVNAYVFDVNTWYGNNRLSKSKLGLYALWDYLDPSLYVGLYSMAKYLVNGAPHLKMATFDVGNYKYIFCPRLLLAPFGPEFQLQNYLVTPGQKLWNVNVRYGNNSQIHSWGADIFLNQYGRMKIGRWATSFMYGNSHYF